MIAIALGLLITFAMKFQDSVNAVLELTGDNVTNVNQVIGIILTANDVNVMGTQIFAILRQEFA